MSFNAKSERLEARRSVGDGVVRKKPQGLRWNRLQTVFWDCMRGILLTL